MSLGLTILLLLLPSQLYLWGPPFFFFCFPSYTSGVHHSSSSPSVFPAISLGFTILLLLLLLPQLYLWGSPFSLFFCVPSYISGIHHSYSSSAFPAISLGFTILLLRSKLYLWGSTFLLKFLCMRLYSNHRGSHIMSSRMAHAGSVFAAGIHPFRIWMSGSLESLRWNACLHRLAFCLYSHSKEFQGMESEPPGKQINPSGGSEKNQTRDAASHRTASLAHYRLSYSGPGLTKDPRGGLTHK